MFFVKLIKNFGGYFKIMIKVGGLVFIRWKEGYLEILRIF